jgi:hypothetical protein
MACPAHRIAADFLGESITTNRVAEAQTRAAAIGGEITITPKGYRLTVGSKSGEVHTWAYLEMMLKAAETAAWLDSRKNLEIHPRHDLKSN